MDSISYAFFMCVCIVIYWKMISNNRRAFSLLEYKVILSLVYTIYMKNEYGYVS